MNGLTWYAVNNAVTLEDLPDLEVLGISVTSRSATPVHVYRDPATGVLLATLGTVRVFRDGSVTIQPRHDCPDGGLVALARTALDCVERDLHRRDRWTYWRATTRVAGCWSARISVRVPDGESVLSAHADLLRPTAAPGPRAATEQTITSA